MFITGSLRRYFALKISSTQVLSISVHFTDIRIHVQSWTLFDNVAKTATNERKETGITKHRAAFMYKVPAVFIKDAPEGYDRITWKIYFLHKIQFHDSSHQSRRWGPPVNPGGIWKTAQLGQPIRKPITLALPEKDRRIGPIRTRRRRKLAGSEWGAICADFQ